jgi:glycosyltransferase involved in cell wall biosynthesis
MIVRNEAHIVREVLDAVAPYISSWVIVDTGSDDGTQDLIRDHMASLGIPGELQEREWRNFGHNRTEALTLAQGRADYIWVMDADDIVVGKPDFTGLDADIYWLRCVDTNDDTFWIPQLFRDGANVRWVGVTHEYAQWDDSCAGLRLEGEYHIADRHLGARNLDGKKMERDRDLLLAELERDPEDARSMFYLAQSYYCMGDFVNARKWYAKRVERGGWYEEVFFSLLRIAESMADLGRPWPDVQDAYLKAWEFQPSRAEPLYEIARHYRIEQRHRIGHLFARRAAQIPFPDDAALFIRADVYNWRAADEQAVCASWTGKQPEAFELCRRILARPDIPDEDRPRITGNRDVCVATMIDAASHYPDALVRSLTAAGFDEVSDGDGVVVSLMAGPELADAVQTLNSFLNCCTDVSRVTRFVVLDAGLSDRDRAFLQERYGFLEIFPLAPGDQLAYLREHIDARFWLHLAHGWRFFAADSLITRLLGVLDAEPEVFQVGINYTDADKLIGICAAEAEVRRSPDAGRYVLTDTTSSGPAMFDAPRLDRVDPTKGLHTATLDEVLCISAL